MNYLKLLNDGYKSINDDADLEDKESKLEYIGSYIFDFTTYENVVSQEMTIKAIEVCNAITNRKTFDYIGDDENNFWYLIMVNMPFFVDKLSWGGSIRGAWWDICNFKDGGKFKINSCGLFNGENQILEIELNYHQWHEFLDAINVFIKEEINNEK